jgi:hypothetical protein
MLAAGPASPVNVPDTTKTSPGPGSCSSTPGQAAPGSKSTACAGRALRSGPERHSRRTTKPGVISTTSALSACDSANPGMAVSFLVIFLFLSSCRPPWAYCCARLTGRMREESRRQPRIARCLRARVDQCGRDRPFQQHLQLPGQQARLRSPQMRGPPRDQRKHGGGPADDPDAIITLESESPCKLAARDLTTQDAIGQAVIEGDHDIAAGFLAAIHGTVASPG